MCHVCSGRAASDWAASRYMAPRRYEYIATIPWVGTAFMAQSNPFQFFTDHVCFRLDCFHDALVRHILPSLSKCQQAFPYKCFLFEPANTAHFQLLLRHTAFALSFSYPACMRVCAVVVGCVRSRASISNLSSFQGHERHTLRLHGISSLENMRRYPSLGEVLFQSRHLCQTACVEDGSTHAFLLIVCVDALLARVGAICKSRHDEAL